MTKKNILTANEIRQLFLDYFEEHKHRIVPSSSLVPNNDPTLLFTNAGMVQFKDVFLGKDPRDYQRAASSQRCVRAGGKHNDLERVGYTARHHTFFEMLGNFSFGDYFKRDAIYFAWNFLTKTLGLPAEKLWVTVYKEDHEAADIWLKDLKVDATRFSYCGEDSNFWSMGATGPCGPCTEIFYDHGADIPGGPPGSPDEDGDRYIEIWNLVFMQYDRTADGTMTPLPKPSVDTGMGLERIAAVMQGVHNNYDIDLFQNLIRAIAKIANTEDYTQTSLRVIADHIRSAAFLIVDDVTPSNEGRGYVLRRIIRRALRHGNKLGIQESFFYKLVAPLAKEMGTAYPELIKQQNHLEKVLRQEEEQFAVTLTQGLKIFEQATHTLKNKMIPGDVAFKLYDTYGFPIDLTADIARERDLTIDIAGFEAAMNEQRERSREASKFGANYHIGAHLDHPTEFTGYETLTLPANIVALYQNDQSVETLKAGDKGSIILDKTPFYAESGGQVGDRGLLLSKNGAVFQVFDTQKQGQSIVHIGICTQGEFTLNQSISAEVDSEKRKAAVLNHTATHLLHMVLRQVLGTHVIQKGSLVEPDRLRFDFSHTSALTAEELKTIEQHVNQEIRGNHEASVSISSPEEAIKKGAMALFEEKYGDQVRVVQFGDSVELCGGTHAHHTGDIGIFKITTETGIAAGIRRLEAVTGQGALRWIEQREQDFKQKLQTSDDKIRQLEKQLEQLKAKLAANMGQDLVSAAQSIGDVKVLSAQLDGIDPKALRDTIDQLKNKLGSAIIALAVVRDGKISIATGVTKDHIAKVKAGELVNMIAQQVGGKGGGRPDFAEAGGNQPENLTRALDSVYEWIKNKI